MKANTVINHYTHKNVYKMSQHTCNFGSNIGQLKSLYVWYLVKFIERPRLALWSYQMVPEQAFVGVAFLVILFIDHRVSSLQLATDLYTRKAKHTRGCIWSVVLAHCLLTKRHQPTIDPSKIWLRRQLFQPQHFQEKWRTEKWPANKLEMTVCRCRRDGEVRMKIECINVFTAADSDSVLILFLFFLDLKKLVGLLATFK